MDPNLSHLLENPDPDPHQSKKLDLHLDMFKIEKPDLDLHKSEKSAHDVSMEPRRYILGNVETCVSVADSHHFNEDLFPLKNAGSVSK